MLSVRLQVQHNFKYIDYPPSRRSWSETPLAVNAFYSKGSNGLWIPAGILQPPFFDAAHPDARNFGSIGCILGHEMSHGFDDQGRRFNADGDLHEWWSAQTVTKYLERAACLVTLFSSYPVGDRFVDGNLTIGENMADLGGVKFSFLAFAASRKRSAVDRRVFFTSYAQSWCAVLNKVSCLCVCVCVTCVRYVYAFSYMYVCLTCVSYVCSILVCCLAQGVLCVCVVCVRICVPYLMCMPYVCALHICSILVCCLAQGPVTYTHTFSLSLPPSLSLLLLTHPLTNTRTHRNTHTHSLVCSIPVCCRAQGTATYVRTHTHPPPPPPPLPERFPS